jgi:endonuclease YncB( thermonuclease family)
MKIAIAALALLPASPTFAQTITDGDTIKLNGMTWRLWGIDAPEARQTCGDAWAAGREATAALRRLIEQQAVACELRGHDRYRRSIGLCRAAGKDLGAELVSSGMAWAFTRYSRDYVEQERAAIAARVGVHAHDCEIGAALEAVLQRGHQIDHLAVVVGGLRPAG